MRRALLLCTVSLAAFFALPARAQEYPGATVRIVVPYAAGGIADVLARLVAVRLEPAWRQSVVVENRAGANGTIAMQHVAQSKPDGYTLMIGNTGTQVVNRFLYRSLPFDIERAFQPVGLIASTPMLLVVAPSHPATSVAELLAMARAEPGKLNFGSAGNGSASHLGVAMLTSMGKVQVAHVPYKGTAQIVPDLLGGRLTGYFDVPGTSLGPIRAGALKPLGVASGKRLTVLPNVPTMAETLPGFELYSWLGLFAPAGLPRDRLDKLNRALRSILEEPALNRQLVDQGNEVAPNTPDEFDAFIRREAVRMGELLSAAGVRPE